MKQIILISISVLISGCLGIGHKGWSDYMDTKVGRKVEVLDPTRFGDAGDYIRANFLISGEGFTHITMKENGDIVQHWFTSEVTSENGREEWVGKCKFYYVVDSKTNVIKSWGIDEGGNPESCRIWP